jgi:hypothetical protein
VILKGGTLFVCPAGIYNNCAFLREHFERCGESESLGVRLAVCGSPPGSRREPANSVFQISTISDIAETRTAVFLNFSV